ncbi:hypothetical protein [Nitrobacter sp. TKz-YC02]|uniref:hypothetical protein n=1 Tax=Nitrobacter sp. TKz-YC02 TaxID=3398704 RepID=UPI003CED0D4C
MAGTIPLSLTQQFDEHGSPLSGGLLYIYQAGTTSTPQSGYQDSDLTIPLPNPITLDAAGRIPAFFLADGSIKVRLTDSAGLTQLVADGLMVIGPSSGGGGGGSVDATTVFATGDVKARYGVGTLSGWVRLNGRTIGSATSGATERANSDAQQLFEYAWGADAGLAVSGGRGASANADWLANKTLTLPDFRGRVVAGMDDMGNTAAGRLTSAGAVTGTTLGYGGGSQFHTMTTGQMPQHAHTASTTNAASTYTLHINGFQTTIDRTAISSINTGAFGPAFTAVDDSQNPSVTMPSGALSLSTTVNNAGSSEPFNIVQPTIVVTYYVKL